MLIGSADSRKEPARSALAKSWTGLRHGKLKRTEVAAARVGRFIYVVGGFQAPSGKTTAAAERYDIARDRWSRVRPMPVPLNHPAAAAYRRSVYVLGGYRGPGSARAVSTLYRYQHKR